jgi:MFS family permease
VIYPVFPDWMVWTALRVLAGFCFSGIYITSESWINNTATNETRGQALSAYMIVQMLGIIASQVLLNTPDPSGFALFIIPSVLVSLAFMPILLAPTPAPAFDSTRRLSFRSLFRISPLGCVGMLLTGGVFSAMFGMASVWGAQAGLSVRDISIFVGALYVGGLVLQYPIGWFSDRIDRRGLIMGLSGVASVTMLVAALLPLPFTALIGVALLLGGITNPVYALLIAYTNDFLSREEMAAASAGLIFLNGFGAIFGPLVTGWLMETTGPRGFFLFIAILYVALTGYALWRMTRRAAPSVSGAFRGMTPGASTLAVEAVLSEGKDTRA